LKKTLKVLSSLGTTVLFLIFTVLLIAVISSKASGGEPSFFGYQIKTVLSGSMEPTFMTGSIIAVKPVNNPTDLKKGDIITFKKDEQILVTHRIIEVQRNNGSVLYKTKGDNNKSADTEPVLSQNVVDTYSGFTIPYVGYFQDFAKSKNGAALLLILPGILLLLYSIISIFTAIKQLDTSSREKDVEKTI
jgi:signal peptidase